MALAENVCGTLRKVEIEYLIEVENHCPAVIVSQVSGLDPAANSTAAQASLHAFNAMSPDSDFRGAVLVYLLSLLNAKSSVDYAKTLLQETTMWPNKLDDVWKNSIAEILSQIIVNDGWERDALMAFMVHGIDRRAEFPTLPTIAPFGSTQFRESPIWKRTLYQAHLGDKDAVAALSDIFNAETSADVIQVMFSDLRAVRPNLAKDMLKIFEYDTRHTSSPDAEFDGPTLAMIVETQMMFLP